MPTTSPIARAKARFERAASIYPYFLISASGGKDSNVMPPLMADLRAKNQDVRVGGFHYTICRGLVCVERPIEILSKRYDFPVKYIVHSMLPSLIYQGYCRPRTGIANTAYKAVLKMNDVELAARVWFAALHSEVDPDDLLPREGEDEARLSLADLKVDPWKIWYVGGQRQNDSLERRAMLSQFRRQQDSRGLPTGGDLGFNPKERRLYPICDWSSKEVYDYCRLMKLPAAADLGRSNSSGINPGDHPTMKALRDNYPKDFAKLLEIFPQAAAVAESPLVG